MTDDPETLPAVLAPTPPPLDGLALLSDATELAARLESYTEARRVFVDWLFRHLVAGVDFQLIHRRIGARGNSQPCPQTREHAGLRCPVCGGKATLCKPGSEKITGLLQLRPTFRRDVETWEMLGKRPGVVALICELVAPNGTIAAEGRGVRSESQDGDDPNKTIKMCQKSAQTDAVLRCGGLSEVFTQDLEEQQRRERVEVLRRPIATTDDTKGDGERPGSGATPARTAPGARPPSSGGEVDQAAAMRDEEEEGETPLERGLKASLVLEAKQIRQLWAAAHAAWPDDPEDPGRCDRELHRLLRRYTFPSVKLVKQVALPALLEALARVEAKRPGPKPAARVVYRSRRR